MLRKIMKWIAKGIMEILTVGTVAFAGLLAHEMLWAFTSWCCDTEVWMPVFFVAVYMVGRYNAEKKVKVWMNKIERLVAAIEKVYATKDEEA